MAEKATGAAEGASGVPHSSQNFACGPTGLPQDGHARESGLPHSVQNFAPARFSAPQVEHITRVALLPSTCSKGTT